MVRKRLWMAAELSVRMTRGDSGMIDGEVVLGNGRPLWT